MKKPFSYILCTALTGLVLCASAGRAAEIGEGFSARAAKAVKNAKATKSLSYYTTIGELSSSMGWKN